MKRKWNLAELAELLRLFPETQAPFSGEHGEWVVDGTPPKDVA